MQITDLQRPLIYQTGNLHRVPYRYVGDITYIHTDEGWLYLAVVMDLYTRKIVGWAMANHMKTQLVNDALLMAL